MLRVVLNTGNWESHPVLHLLGSAQAEGTSLARIVGALARGLDPARYKLHACFLEGDGPLAAELEAAGVHVSVVNWARGARDPVGAWRFWRSLRGQQFTIIHQHFGGRAPLWLARWATRAKVIRHLHGYLLESRGLEITPVSARGADLVIAVSQAAADCVAGGKAKVVYPGVSLQSWLDRKPAPPRNGNGLILGTVGRLVPIKGLVYLVRALAVLRQEIPDVRLEIAGSGPERPAIESEVQSLGLAGTVIFLGWQHDLEGVLPGWDVFVQPSLADSFPIATLEAMAAGLPVVASGVGGLRELVEDGRTGWLVPPADPAALTKRLRDLALNPAQRRAMGMAGRERARAHFSVERMVEEIGKIYDELLAGGGRRGR